MSEACLIKFVPGVSAADKEAIVSVLRRERLAVSEGSDGMVAVEGANMHQLHHICHGQLGFAGVSRLPDQEQEEEQEPFAQTGFPPGTLAW